MYGRSCSNHSSRSCATTRYGSRSWVHPHAKAHSYRRLKKCITSGKYLRWNSGPAKRALLEFDICLWYDIHGLHVRRTRYPSRDHPLHQQATMSRASKITLGATSLFTLGAVVIVHFQQKMDQAVSIESSISKLLPQSERPESRLLEMRAPVSSSGQRLTVHL
jgi:hypothetical protein